MRFALRKPSGNLAAEVGEDGAIGLEWEGPFYYETLREATSAANRRHQAMDGLGGRTQHWFAVTVVQEQFPRPEALFVMVCDTDCCS